MKVVGIVAEYNPFHNGHLYQLNKIRRQLDADYILVIMSGNYTQRGEAAILNKFLRTEAALLGGADLVLELPVYSATASAELFAFSAIAHLNATGVVDTLCFGTETPNTQLLSRISEILLLEPESYRSNLKTALKRGLNFPSARSLALNQYLNDIGNTADLNDMDGVLDTPNNILGIEYMKALKKTNSPIKPCPILRKGSGYHELCLDNPVASATAIRNHLISGGGLDDLYDNIPECMYHIIKDNPWPVDHSLFSAQLSYALLRSGRDYTGYADITRDLSQRICRLLPEFKSFEQFSGLLKTKSYTRTRLNRCLLHILLDITRDNMEHFSELDYCAYLRVLGFRKNSQPLLNAISQNSSRLLFTKLAAAEKKLEKSALALLNHEIFASQVYNSAVQLTYGVHQKSEYQQGVIITHNL